ncbi:MAG: response regulator transcription factor [Cyanobacteria bacterium]|nr:response regulator transcription factor [Cyanobacteriota bacterium]
MLNFLTRNPENKNITDTQESAISIGEGNIHPIKVLIIDDYKLTRIGLRGFFKQTENISVVGEAESGEEGVLLAQTLKPHVILMDLGLPGINGIEATRQVKKTLPDCKIIILTSHHREEEVLESLKEGAQGYCLKDIDPSRLIEVIQSVSEGAAWLDPAIASIALTHYQNLPKQNPGASLPVSRGQALFNTSPDIETTKPKEPCYKTTFKLTERELEVLKLLVEGKSNTEIAKELVVSVHTAKAHVCNILQKFYVEDRVQAAVKAVKEGII